MIKLNGYSPLETESHYTLQKAPEYYWVFKAATWGDEARRDKLLSQRRTEIQGDKRILVSDVTDWELITMELFLSFGGTNIPGENGKPLIKMGVPYPVFQERLGMLPRPLILELWEECRRINPHWDPFWDDEEPEQDSLNEGESEGTSGNTSSTDEETTDSSTD